MKYVVLGGGLAGCTMGYFLRKKGHDVIIIEKEDKLGGMIKTYYKEGIKYEQGPHLLESESQKLINFIESLIKVQKRLIMGGTYVEGQYLFYPVHIRDVFRLKEREKIIMELYKLNPNGIKKTNFEDYVISQMGETMYKIFYYGYTKKFWQIEPRNMTSEWAMIRHITFRIGDDLRTWRCDWQGYPKNDYNELIDKLSDNIEVVKGEVLTFDPEKGVRLNNGTFIKGDFYVSTLHIDDIFGCMFGKLPYRGVEHEFKLLNQEHYFPETGYKNSRFSYVYYPDPNDDKTRIAEYKHMTGQECDKTLISIARPSTKRRLWPFYTQESQEQFRQYIDHVSKIPNFMTAGRLGLYIYATIDVTIRMCMKAMEFIEDWNKKTSEEKKNAYQEIRDESKKRKD